MKRLLSVGFVLGISVTVYSQNKSLEIGTKTNAFYSSYERLEEEHIFENIQTTRILSLNRFQGEIFLNKVDTNGTFYRLSLGFLPIAIKSKSVRVGDNGGEGIQDDKFKYIYFGLGYGKQYRFANLQFRFFTELPVRYKIQNYREIEFIRHDTQGNVKDKTVVWSKEPKDISAGLNLGYSVYYSLSKTISVGLETKTGFLLTRIKGDFETVTEVYDNKDNLLQSYVEPSNKDLTALIMSPFDVSLGLRIRL